MVDASHDKKMTKKLKEEHRLLVVKHTARLKEEAMNEEGMPS